MTILILNCDADSSLETNGGALISRLAHNSRIINVYKGESLTNEALSIAEKIIITGSRTSVYDNEHWIEDLIVTIRKISKLGIPTLGICFGYQAIAVAMGGVVEKSNSFEEGFTEVNLTKMHWLFNGFSRSPIFYQSHSDIISKLPGQAISLAKNSFSVQAFALENFCCVQFHPEITASVAKKMADRDGKALIIPASIDENYCQSEKIIQNFITHHTKT